MADNSGADFKGVINTGANACTTELDQMKVKLTQLEKDIEQLKYKLDGLESRIVSLQERIKDTKEEIEKKEVDADKFEKKKNNSVKDILAGYAIGTGGLILSAATGGAALPLVVAGLGAAYGGGNLVAAVHYKDKEDTCRKQIREYEQALRQCKSDKEKVKNELISKMAERNELLEKIGKHNVSKVETECIQKQLDLTQSESSSGPDLTSTGSTGSDLDLQLQVICDGLQSIKQMPGYGLDEKANTIVTKLVEDANRVVLDFETVSENQKARQAVIDTAKTIETATKNNKRRFEVEIQRTYGKIEDLDKEVEEIKDREMPRVGNKISELNYEENNLQTAVEKLQEQIAYLQQLEDEALNRSVFGVTVMALARLVNTVTFGLTDILSTIGGALAGIDLNSVNECQNGRRRANQRIGEIQVDMTKLETERNRLNDDLIALMQERFTSTTSIDNMKNLNMILDELFKQISAIGTLATAQVV